MVRMAENSWYVARVRIGAEENVRIRCLEQISSQILRDCYVFHYKEKRNVQGEWIVQEQILFPGYVFLVVRDVEAEKINRELRKVKSAIEILEMDGKLAVLTDEEVNFLLELSGQGQIIEFSEGIIEQSKVRIYSGPLVGKEKYIRKIDRHKRRAVLEMSLFGEKQEMLVGLEIVLKTH